MNESAKPASRRWTLTLCLLGLVLCALLELVHVRTYLVPGSHSFCSVGDSFDCASVAAASSSIFLGLPWAVWGGLGFVALGAAALRRSAWLVPLALLGSLLSVGLLLVQVLQIGSICLLCEAVHATIWALTFVALRQRRSLARDWTDRLTLYVVFVPFATLAVTALLFLPSYWSAFSYRSEPPFATGQTTNGYPWIGASEPRLVVHEFTDYRCPHCKVATTRTLRWLAAHPDLRLVRHQQPGVRCRPGTPYCEAVRLAYCAEEQGKFWRADRWLFAHATARPVDVDALVQALELDRSQLLACSVRPDIHARGEAEFLAAKKRRLVDVPSYVVDDQRVRPDKLRELVEKRLR